MPQTDFMHARATEMLQASALDLLDRMINPQAQA